MSRINILQTYIDNLSMSETLSRVFDAIDQNEQIHHVVVNAGKIVAIQTDPRLKQSVNNSDLINADGQAVVWGISFFGKASEGKGGGN